MRTDTLADEAEMGLIRLMPPINGDEFEQQYERLLYGAIVGGYRQLADSTTLTWGGRIQT